MLSFSNNLTSSNPNTVRGNFLKLLGFSSIKNFSIVLSDKNSKSLFVPAGFAHGYFTLAKENYVIYSCTEYREAKNELGILYSDKDLNIKWPKKKIII